MTYAVLIAALLLATPSAIAQDRSDDCSTGRYEAGIAVGRNQYFGDLHCSSPYVSSGFNMGIQGFVRRQISPLFGLRGNLFIGGLSANDFDNPTGRWDYRGARFTSPLVELAGLIELHLLGQTIQKGAKLRRFSPYLLGGLGVAYTNPVVRLTTLPNVTFFPPEQTYLDQDVREKNHFAVVIPAGVGLKVTTTPKLSLNAELVYRFTNSDYIDGFSASAYIISNGSYQNNSKYNDSYLIASVGVSYRLGNSLDSDGDGVANACDDCPNLYGKGGLRGCPDADNDGVIDPEDTCPDEFGDPATCGCPDDDLDGVPNDCDCCPNEKGDRAYHGCPKEHGIEYKHTRMPARMRYCPFCPPDLPIARQSRKTTRPDSAIRKTR